MSNLKKWTLLATEDVSPSQWFPLEKRKYQMPNGKIVDDFYVTTLEDSVHIVPITKEGKIVLIRMYKQGADEIMIQFPAGRFEAKKHKNKLETAQLELEEETGIKVKAEDLEYVGKFALMTTKASEYAHLYLVRNVEFNSQQNLDDNEEIEILQLWPDEVDQYILEGKIADAPAITNWYLIKNKYL